MRAGTLNSRATIQRRAAEKNAFGQVVGEWVDVATVWANVRYFNGKEYTTSGQEIGAATVSVRIRYRKDVTTSMRVLCGGYTLNIKAVLPDTARREYVDLACETGKNDG